MTNRADGHKKIQTLLSRKPEGVDYADLRQTFSEESKTDLDLLILQEVRTGKVWVHKGRYFSKTQYDRAVKNR